MKQYIETIYSLSRIIIACIMICLPYGSCQLAGWLMLDFCLALFFIQRIDNKRMLTLVIVAQLIITILLFITLNTFTAVKSSTGDSSAIVRAYDNDWLSNFETGQSDDNWIGMDMETLESVAYVRIVPRSDDNDIHPGDEYDLRYWNANNF